MFDSNLRREIFEQPQVLARLLERERSQVERIAAGLRKRPINYLMIAARGSSDNAATFAKYVFALLVRKSTALAAPSLFTLYHRPPDLSRSLVMAVSQSGESPDILAVVEEGRRQGAPTLAITNRSESALARAADDVILLHAGEELSVAATKTFTASLGALALLAAAWGATSGLVDELETIPEMMERALGLDADAQAVAGRLAQVEECAVFGRGINYATAFELALKLKELAYVQAEPYSSADFMHGPLALVDPDFCALEIAPSGEVYENMLELTGRIKRAGGHVIAISDREEVLQAAEAGLQLAGPIPEWLSPLVAIVPGQLLALHLTQAKGFDVDRPRSISKVTRTV